MKLSLLSSALVLQALLLAILLRSANAADTTQTLNLCYGWNAVWLEVEPRGVDGGVLTADQVFQSANFRVDRVASQTGFIGTAEFTSDPNSLFNQGGWDMWASDPASGESANIAIRGNHAYLVHVVPNSGLTAQNGDPAGVLQLQGKVVFYQPTWAKGAFNLVGFGIQDAPTFASLMAGSNIEVDGAAAASPNVQKLDSATGAWKAVKGTDIVESGKSYWVNVPYTLEGNGWAGPVAADFTGAITGGLNFGSGPGALSVIDPADSGGVPVLMSSSELTFSNLERTGGSQHQVSLRRLSPTGLDPAAGDLQFFALEPVTDQLTWQRLSVDFNAGWPATTLMPGASKSVTGRLA
jgi:hypothetical protein